MGNLMDELLRYANWDRGLYEEYTKAAQGRPSIFDAQESDDSERPNFDLIMEEPDEPS